MNFKEMSIEELEARRLAIAEEVETEDADLDALEEEARGIKEELESRKAEETKKAEIRSAIAAGEGVEIRKFDDDEKEEEKEMTNEEVRSSKEYIDAFKNYILTDDDKECRALLTENVEGTVPVPSFIEGYIRTAWEKNRLMDLVAKTYVRGNLKLGFELSATGAEVHIEGDMENLPAEEQLTLGTVVLVPQSIKKWITISDEAIDMGGEEFLRYIYDELTYRIAQKAEEVLIGLINDAPTTPAADKVAVAEVTAATLDVTTIPTALGKLSGDAANPVVVTTRANWAALKVAALSGSFPVDPFEGMEVIFASEDAMGDTIAIVGDFGYGAHANFPNGSEIRIKYDDLSLAEKDLVKLVGRQYVGLGLVANNAFVRIVGE